MGAVFSNDWSFRTQSALFKAATHQFAKMSPQQVSNTLYGFARMAVKARWFPANYIDAVSNALVKLSESRRSTSQSISVSLWALATMEATMEHDLPYPAMIGAAVRLSCDMTSQHVANTIWALGKMGAVWSQLSTTAELQSAIIRCSGDMSSQDVSNTLLGLADSQASWSDLSAETQSALFQAIRRNLPRMTEQVCSLSHSSCKLTANLSNLSLYSFVQNIFNSAVAIAELTFNVPSVERQQLGMLYSLLVEQCLTIISSGALTHKTHLSQCVTFLELVRTLHPGNTQIVAMLDQASATLLAVHARDDNTSKPHKSLHQALLKNL